MRWLVVVAMVGCGGGGDDSGRPPPLEFGPTQQATINGGGIDFSTGAVNVPGDIEIASNLEVGCRANAYVAPVGPVTSPADVTFPDANGYARSANAPPHEGLAVRAADGCPVAVYMIDHTDTGLSGGQSMTIEYARALCKPMQFVVHPRAESVTCNPGWLQTGPPSIAFHIAGYPPIESALSATMDTTFSLALPPGVHVTPTVQPISMTPTTVTWMGSCTGATCDLTPDSEPSASAVVAWTPKCFPGP